MAIRHMNYKQIPRGRRKSAATVASGKMREMLRLNPVLTDEQRVAVTAQISQLQSWVNGDLDPGDPPAMVAKSEHHEIIIEEEVAVEEHVE